MTTTTNRAYNLSNYPFRSGESFLFDTNVWLYLYPASLPRKPRGYVADYSRAFKLMLSAGVRLVVDVLVLSEYLNRYCRIAWEARYSHLDFKSFRKSSEFVEVDKRAAVAIRRILKLSKRVDHPLTQVVIPQLLTDFETGASDFNDGLIAQTCRLHGWKLVTNDADFTTGGIEVLTMNRKLLRACR